ELSPVLALAANFDPNQISTKREISAAAINVSGRQRMLSQRTALLSLRLVCNQDRAEQEKLRHQLLLDIDLMETSHNGLLNGDEKMKLSGHLSEALLAMYFEPPFNLDREIRNYIAQVRALAQASTTELTQDNPHLRYIQDAASTQLLIALDAVVNQYQKDNEAQQLALDIDRAELYCQSCAATAAAKVQAEKLEKALQELKQTQAQLIHSERISSLGQLVASLAHEINNPVSFVHGNLSFANTYVQHLLELVRVYDEQYPQPNRAIQEKIEEIDLEFLSQDLPQVLSSMTVGIDRICQIVRSLRSFSRIDENEMKPVNLHDGIDSTLLILQNRFKAKNNRPGIEVIKEYGNLPLVECYAGQINQVLMNAIANAIDAIEDRIDQGSCFNPKIEIVTAVVGQSALIRIADNGIGMTEEVRSRLFDSFFTTKPLGKGTGLGLSISYQIVVEKHGGALWCESTPGQGTEFKIEIPLRQGVRAQTTLVSTASPLVWAVSDENPNILDKEVKGKKLLF
ncbi:MAG TPA: histidine kinase, partial [Cyanobacteria bacterium UBA11368]|nr:histidine kinase [Cyanobacteria bacterium UBA11368]